MARKPQVRYFDSRKAYYCQIGGKQHLLHKSDVDDSAKQGPNFAAACAAYGRLMATGSPLEQAQQGDGLGFYEVVNFYSEHLKSMGRGEGSDYWKRYCEMVNPFVAVCQHADGT